MAQQVLRQMFRDCPLGDRGPQKLKSKPEPSSQLVFS